MIRSDALLVLLTVLAVARLTVLVNDDYVTEPLRARVDARSADGGRWAVLAYFLTCPWCVSIWLGLPAAGAVYAWHDTWPVQVLLIGLSASYITGMLAVARDAIEGES